MNEIEKLYENAGINKSCHANIKFDDCIHSPSDCGYYNYPDFTTEKQIELIKWLAKWGCQIARTDDSSVFQVRLLAKYKVYEDKNFEECLANPFNNFWQDLTEEEKEQVKGILNE